MSTLHINIIPSHSLQHHYHMLHLHLSGSESLHLSASHPFHLVHNSIPLCVLLSPIQFVKHCVVFFVGCGSVCCWMLIAFRVILIHSFIGCAHSIQRKASRIPSSSRILPPLLLRSCPTLNRVLVLLVRNK